MCNPTCAPRSRGNRRGSIALAFASLLVSLALGEVALRWHLQRTQGFGSLRQFLAYEEGARIPTRSRHPLVVITRLSADKKLIYDLRPDMEKSFGGKLVRTNHAGMREDRDYAFEDSARTVRIVGVGDSGMWGWAVHQGEEYLAVLERSLAKRTNGVRYEVLNLAVPGYNTQQEVQMLRSRGLAYSPDVVLLGWCNNDYGAPLFLYKRKNFFGWDAPYLYALAFDRQRFRDSVRPEVLKLGDIDRDLVDPSILRDTGPEGVRRQLAALRDLSRDRGFKLLVVGPMGARVIDMCRALGIDYFDTRKEISAVDVPAGARVYGCHPNAAGHAVLAARLEGWLDRKGWLDGGG